MDGPPILSYHSIDNSGSFISVAPNEFEEQMDFLHKKGDTTVTLREYVNSLIMNEPAHFKSIVLTFYDSYKKNYDIAFPILKTFRFTATIFLVARFMDRMDFWEKDKAILDRSLLSWNEVLEMKKYKEYGIDLQPHGYFAPW